MVLTCNKIHHPKANRLYLHRAQEGQDLIQLKIPDKTTTIGLAEYLKTSNDWMLKLVEDHERCTKLHYIMKESKNVLLSLCLIPRQSRMMKMQQLL